MIDDKKKNNYLTDKIIKKLHIASQPYTSHKFSDQGWENLHELIDVLRNVDGVEELYYGGGRYYNFRGEGAYKEYTVDIITSYGTKIKGTIQCHFAGTMEDPYSAYDMTVNFYKNNEKENEIMENKKIVKLTESDLHKIIKECVNNTLNEISRFTAKSAYNKSLAKSMDNNLSPDERNFHAMRANSFDNYYREKGKNDRLMKTPKRDGESDESFYKRVRLKNARMNAQDSAFDSGKMKYKDGKWREEK